MTNDKNLTAEQAETLYAQLHAESGALSDEELDNVSGGYNKISMYDEGFIALMRFTYCGQCEPENLNAEDLPRGLVCKGCIHLFYMNDEAASYGYPPFKENII